MNVLNTHKDYNGLVRMFKYLFWDKVTYKANI